MGDRSPNNYPALRPLFVTGFAILTALSPALAAAQAELEEIVVTAERREASLQDTAISITALTGEQLQRRGIQTSEQLAGFTPGLQIQRDVIGKVVIRGIGAENFTVAGDPGVALSVDGVYIARSSVAILDLFDMQRVEVLRGPQGTLYGRNATGGAINLISNKPGEEFDFTVFADAGDYGKARIEAAVGGALVSDRLLGRLAVLSHQRDGFTDNVFPNVGRGLDELDDRDLFASRLQLRWLVSDSVSVDFAADYYNDDSNPVPYKYPQDPLIFLGGAPFANPLAGNLRTVSQGYEFDVPGLGTVIDEAGAWDQSGFSATINWDINDRYAFKSISAVRNIDFEWLNDGDGIEEYLVNYFQVDASEQFSQEFQLTSTGDGPMNWVAGFYYLREDSDSFIGIPLPLGANLPLAVIINGESKTDAYALFGEMSYSFSDQWRLNLGLRYNYEEKDVRYVDDRSSLGGAAVTVDETDDWSSVTPKIGIDYFASDDVMLYGSITKGFKSGGFNLLAVQPSYDEEEVLSYEVGIKSQLADNRVQLNASAFYYDYTDLQVGKVQELSATIQNAAEATIFGAEVELRALLSDDFEINAGLSLLDSEYDEFDTQDPAPPGDEVSLKGNELPRAPGFTGSVAGLYSLDLEGGSGLEFWANWQYTGEQFFTPFNRPDVRQGGFDVWNAKISYLSPSRRWQVSLYGENLGDEEYFTNALESGVPTPGVDPVTPQFFVGAPRTWGVQVRYNLSP